MYELILTGAQLRAVHEALYQFVENEEDAEAFVGESKFLPAARKVLDALDARHAALAEDQGPRLLSRGATGLLVQQDGVLLEWRSGSMTAPAFEYYDTRREAREARRRMRGGSCGSSA